MGSSTRKKILENAKIAQQEKALKKKRMREAQAIFDNLGFNERIQDLSETTNKIEIMNDSQFEKWKQNPKIYDINGIDSKNLPKIIEEQNSRKAQNRRNNKKGLRSQKGKVRNQKTEKPKRQSKKSTEEKLIKILQSDASRKGPMTQDYPKFVAVHKLKEIELTKQINKTRSRKKRDKLMHDRRCARSMANYTIADWKKKYVNKSKNQSEERSLRRSIR